MKNKTIKIIDRKINEFKETKRINDNCKAYQLGKETQFAIYALEELKEELEDNRFRW